MKIKDIESDNWDLKQFDLAAILFLQKLKKIQDLSRKFHVRDSLDHSETSRNSKILVKACPISALDLLIECNSSSKDPGVVRTFAF